MLTARKHVNAVRSNVLDYNLCGVHAAGRSILTLAEAMNHFDNNGAEQEAIRKLVYMEKMSLRQQARAFPSQHMRIGCCIAACSVACLPHPCSG